MPESIPTLCPRCGSRIVREVQSDGETDRYCLAASHPYITAAEALTTARWLASPYIKARMTVYQGEPE
jgi:hypothetical protein